MKHFAGIMTVTLASLLASNAQAQYTGPPANTITTVKDILANGWHDQPVQLQGRIVRHLGGEDYEFADSSGTIHLEIDDKIWRWVPGKPVNGKNEAKIFGKFERKGWGHAKVDADHVEVLR
ncbi:NirD/YgiW/YdeI family stress tolerance protein [Burkholderia gladioli]|uniref:NirD/YgiW/YdeI family stress tolerance protein n=1 Tax=Burkholderia gladioli TaxID=28095 RepID=UPI001641C479|nr:NirD/YgiW/YdeI family stress tolerance protein [Burkholderia gladioli]